MTDTKEKARDRIANGIALFRGMDKPDATDIEEADAILDVLADAGLVIAPVDQPTKEMRIAANRVWTGGRNEGFYIDRIGHLTKAWPAMMATLTSPASPAPATARETEAETATDTKKTTA